MLPEDRPSALRRANIWAGLHNSNELGRVSVPARSRRALHHHHHPPGESGSTCARAELAALCISFLMMRQKVFNREHELSMVSECRVNQIVGVSDAWRDVCSQARGCIRGWTSCCCCQRATPCTMVNHHALVHCPHVCVAAVLAARSCFERPKIMQFIVCCCGYMLFCLCYFQVLQSVWAEHPWLTPDCGNSQVLRTWQQTGSVRSALLCRTA